MAKYEAVKLDDKSLDKLSEYVEEFRKEYPGYHVNYIPYKMADLWPNPKDLPEGFKKDMLAAKKRVKTAGAKEAITLYKGFGGNLPHAPRHDILQPFIGHSEAFSDRLSFTMSESPLDIVNMSSSKYFSSCFSLEHGEYNGALFGELLNPFSLIAKVDSIEPTHDSMVARTLVYFFPRKEDTVVVINPWYFDREFANDGGIVRFNYLIQKLFKKDPKIHVIFNSPRRIGAKVINLFAVPPDVYVKPDEVEHFQANRNNPFCMNLQITC